jgi:hypothetical protein
MATRPKARPANRKSSPNDEGIDTRALTSTLAPTKSKRPKARPEKMAKGGMCRGMGAAKRGGSYKAM